VEYRARARRLLASAPNAHSTKWADNEGRGSNMVERNFLGIYKDGAVTAMAMTDSIVASGGRDGYVRAGAAPRALRHTTLLPRPATCHVINRVCPPRHRRHVINATSSPGFIITFLELNGII